MVLVNGCEVVLHVVQELFDNEVTGLLIWCSRWAWPMYWMAQGTMFWALFVVGHDW